MNRLHHWYCASPGWSRYVREELVPSSIAGVDLGEHLLEVGPGPGKTTDVLAATVDRLTVLEIDPVLAAALARRLSASRVAVSQGDATRMPFRDGQFSAVACFTVLHHVPTPRLQDRIFAEARRVLRPRGVFLGSDNAGSGWRFRLLHLWDTRTVVDPETLPGRLRAAGFTDVDVTAGPRVRFRASVAG